MCTFQSSEWIELCVNSAVMLRVQAFLLQWLLSAVACESPKDLYEDLLKKQAVYGDCWGDAILLVKNACSKSCLTTEVEAQSVLAMYNCFLKKFERRHVECSNSMKIIKCSDLHEELSDSQHRLVFAEFRRFLETFCQQWRGSHEHREVASQVIDSDDEVCSGRSLPLPKLSSIIELIKRLKEILFSFIKMLLSFPYFLIFEYVIHFFILIVNRMKPFIGYCLRTILISIWEVFGFLRSSSVHWRSMLQIAVSNINKCKPSNQHLRMNIIAHIAWINSFLFHLATFTVIRSYWNYWRRLDHLKEHIVLLLISLSYLYENKIILYTQNGCSGVDDSFEKTTAFLQSHQFASRVFLLVILLFKFVVDLVEHFRVVWRLERSAALWRDGKFTSNNLIQETWCFFR